MATGGFLYMGTFMHKWLTATQYIAPLMGNFNPSLNDSSYIRYLDTGSSFTCEWSQLHLDDQVEVGSFTFQATLKKDGVIIFAYKNVPISLSLVGTTQHPVKVGLADAFYVDEKIYGNYYRRTIYEYHDVPLNKTYIKTDVAFIIEPLPTCNQLDTCDGCINSDIDFQCGWCHSVKRCSDGFDRHRQDWLAGGCDEKSGELLCTGESTSRNTGSGNTSLGVGGIIAIVAVIILLCSLAVFVIFAYMNPTSRPGLFLISLRYCFRKDTSASAADNSDKYAVTMDQDSRPIDTPPAQLPYPDSTEA
uniref:Plexin domain-containing protein 2-like n=1 Tax=Saccoglossus kowalevskii TaxID=10224 RepID=A0ABM0MT78_SACKO|nr:PREDICTED: plexin domain-containing protein 2-like [Saccoglossus kowalevskii]